MTTATLYPGATGDAYIKIENPNRYPVKVDTIRWNPADGAKATGGIGECVNTGLYFGEYGNGGNGNGGTLSGLALTVGAKATESFTLANAVHMINAVQDGCQGATFSLKVTVSGASAA